MVAAQLGVTAQAVDQGSKGNLVDEFLAAGVDGQDTLRVGNQNRKPWKNGLEPQAARAGGCARSEAARAHLVGDHDRRLQPDVCAAAAPAVRGPEIERPWRTSTGMSPYLQNSTPLERA